VKSLVILMMEEEQPEGLSARKLVAETAKHNVLTAYSADDGMRLLRRFPKVDVVLVHTCLLERREGLLGEIKGLEPDVPIILANPFHYPAHPDVSYFVDSHNPQQLLKLLNDTIPKRWQE
jgi:hypothetical protein